MEDLQYIKRVLHGEPEAYKYLVRQHQHLAMRTAMSILKNEADSKDVVQISFIKAYESLKKFHGDAKFSSWLCRIVINQSFRSLQKRNRIDKMTQEYAKTDMPLVRNEGLANLNKRDMDALLKKGLSLISPKEALCVQLFYLEQYGIEEIQKITGISSSSVKVLLFRGRKKLYKHLLASYKNMN